MKKILLVITFILLFMSASTVQARDGFEVSNTFGDPAYNDSYVNDAAPSNSDFSMPVKRVMIVQSDNGAVFSERQVLLVTGQSFGIKAYSGFGSNYAFSGDANFAGLFQEETLFKSWQFYGTATTPGLAEARIIQNGVVVSRLGIEVIKPFVVDDSGNKQTVSMPLYSWIMVKLDGNPTTGYDWQLVSQCDNINIADSGYMLNAAAKQMTGAPSKKYFLIQAVKAGQSVLTLQYFRPWEPQNIAGNFQLNIDVAAGE